MIEDLITKQVNAIVISPNEPTSVVDVINDGLSKGILMMTFDSDSPDSNRVMYIGTDNKTAGKIQGETLREALGGSGKIGIITGGLGALNLNERIEGFRETIGSDIEVVEVVATDDDLQKGLGVSEALLRAHPDLNGVACVSATGGPTLAQVIQGPEFADRELTIVAFDDLKEVLDAIEAGIIYATMVQRPVQMGKLSISESHEDPDPGLRPGVRPPRHRGHRGDRGEPHHLHQVGMHRRLGADADGVCSQATPTWHPRNCTSRRKR